MERKLFLEKLSDSNLKKLIERLEEVEITGTTNNETVMHYANTWYNCCAADDRIQCLQGDVYREATCRWMDKMNH